MDFLFLFKKYPKNSNFFSIEKIYDNLELKKLRCKGDNQKQIKNRFCDIQKYDNKLIMNLLGIKNYLNPSPKSFKVLIY